MLLTALGGTLRKRHGHDATLILMEGHGREPLDRRIDVSRTVGWFTTLFPFVLRVAGDARGAQVAAVRQDLRDVPRNGIGFGLACALAPKPVRAGLATHPLPRLAFNYLGEFSSASSDGVFTLAGDAPGPIDPALERHSIIDVTA